ncbi:hypothetical protein DICPUDRAFT_78109 [Dictyostelium purpureum]|uniref:TgrO1-like immunoglobulin-like domain-containing protein n=1 Tax=Dictyostelium purpureum TaxID=5786 RepID=F0ZIK6_DICPU|nr:uncharacterized protein DICPUDRAFT_78109 [Dictyostelium purpureum]EGC36230.1 hypothetical protein DICPUDRAFT_78109 [Dictyostelium purpureum]|eukprot:XP_003287239.1 hypothetical protein DICPUDRAFT_78109 [Dictyostelium purpureum]
MICVLLNDRYVGTFDLSVFIYLSVFETYTPKCNREKCVIELNDTQIKNFYGNSIKRYTIYLYEVDTYNLKGQSFDPINYAIFGLPLTEVSKLQLTGNYLRNYVNDYYKVDGEARGYGLQFSVDKENFDPENLTVNFPPGYGSFILYPDSSLKRLVIYINYAPIFLNVIIKIQ